MAPPTIPASMFGPSLPSPYQLGKAAAEAVAAKLLNFLTSEKVQHALVGAAVRNFKVSLSKAILGWGLPAPYGITDPTTWGLDPNWSKFRYSKVFNGFGGSPEERYVQNRNPSIGEVAKDVFVTVPVAGIRSVENAFHQTVESVADYWFPSSRARKLSTFRTWDFIVGLTEQVVSPRYDLGFDTHGGFFAPATWNRDP